MTTKESDDLERILKLLDPSKHAAMATRLALVGLTGDGIGEVFNVPPVPISIEAAPVETLQAKAADGRDRRIPSKAARPRSPSRRHDRSWRPGYAALREAGLLLPDGPVQTRFLQAGHVVIQATFRDV